MRLLAVVINRMTYYNISQGRVEIPIRRGGQLYCGSVAKLLSICVPETIITSVSETIRKQPLVKA